MANTKILPFNWSKRGVPMCSIKSPAHRETVFRLLQAGRRWVKALGSQSAWVRGMAISFDFSRIEVPDDLAHVFGSYPNGSFAGYMPSNSKYYPDRLIAVDPAGVTGRWVVPTDAIPDFNEPATIGGALFVLRKLDAQQDMLIVNSIMDGKTADIAEAFAGAAERIAIRRLLKEV